MTYASVASGIEAATMAWHPIGWKPVWFSEIAGFPCRLLKHYYPNVPNLGDMLKIENNETFQQSILDLLVGGTPCQDYSTAGKRAGIAGDKGQLTLEFCRILKIKRPKWFVWENVPGVFSLNRGRDFQKVITSFRECGYSISWRTMDAQFFGVPQRRRRVFVVGYLGNDWRPSASVLFEPGGMCGNPPESPKERADIAGTIGRRTGGRSIGAEEAGGNLLQVTARVARTLRARWDSSDDGTRDNLILTGSHGPMATGQANAEILTEQSPTLNCNHEAPIVWSIMPQNSGKDFKARQVEVTQPLTTATHPSNQGGMLDQHSTLISTQHRQDVRRLTPLEFERLQGFPDGYTAIPGAADSPRYESIGNSMAVPVMRWIGRRIDHYDKIFK